MKIRRVLVVAVLAVVLLVGWVAVNPPGKFGVCFFGLTTYGAVPRPAMDFQVRADGETRQVARTHELTNDTIRWLLEPKPDLLIISIGWDGQVSTAGAALQAAGVTVKQLRTGEAIQLYNQSKASGLRVAIHVHSTC